jgi:hypothetical protein
MRREGIFRHVLRANLHKSYEGNISSAHAGKQDGVTSTFGRCTRKSEETEIVWLILTPLGHMIKQGLVPCAPFRRF